jgi:tetratricopeptide (TPR) repeat protein
MEGERQEWDRLFSAGVTAETNRNFTEALELYRQAERLDPKYAELRFRQARCEWALNHYAQAKEHFIQARDADALRFRADTRLNAIIRSAAARFANSGVVLLDVEHALARQATNGVPGEEMFYEHVHFNFEGNCALARLAGEQVLKFFAGSVPLRRPWLSDAQCAERLALSDAGRKEVMDLLGERLNRAPFTYQLDHAQAWERFTRRNEEIKTQLTPQALQTAVALHRQAVTNAPDDWVIHRNLSKLLLKLDDASDAAREAREVTRLVPHWAEAWSRLGVYLAQTDSPDEAIAVLDKSLELDPGNIDALLGVALVRMRQGRFAEAAAQFEHILRLKPDWVDAHIGLGRTLDSLGRSGEAEGHVQEALQIEPGHAGAKRLLSELLSRDVNRNQAAVALVEEVQRNPNNFDARLKLGQVLGGVGRFDEARIHLEEAVRLKPDSAEAHGRLGLELARAGRDAEALPHFAEMVRLAPDNADAHANLGIALAKAQRLEEAARQFEQALAINPDDSATSNYLQFVRQRLRR